MQTARLPPDKNKKMIFAIKVKLNMLTNLPSFRFLPLFSLIIFPWSSLFASNAIAGCDKSKCQLELQTFKGPLISAAVVSAVSSLQIGDNVLIQESDTDAGGIISVSGESVIGSGSQVGNIYTNKLLLKSDSKVLGNIFANDVVHENGNPVAHAKLDETVIPDSTSIALEVPAFSATTPTIQINPFSRMTLHPGRYKNLVVNDRAELAIRTGIYFFDSVEALNGSTISINTEAGTAYIFILSQWNHAGKFTYTGPSSDLVINYLGEKRVEISGEMDANINAPNATVEIKTIGPRIVHEGTVYAKSVLINSENTIRAARASNTGKAAQEVSALFTASQSDQLALGSIK